MYANVRMYINVCTQAKSNLHKITGVKMEKIDTTCAWSDI